MTDTPAEEPHMDWPAPIPGNAPAIAGSPWLETTSVEQPDELAEPVTQPVPDEPPADTPPQETTDA